MAEYSRTLVTKKMNPLLQLCLLLDVGKMNYLKMGRIMATLHQTLRKFGMVANLIDAIKNFTINL